MSELSDFYALATIFGLGIALAFWMHRQDTKVRDLAAARVGPPDLVDAQARGEDPGRARREGRALWIPRFAEPRGRALRGANGSVVKSRVGEGPGFWATRNAVR